MKKTKTNSRTLLEIINEKDIKDLITVDPKSPVMEALSIMDKYKIGALIVLNKNKISGTGLLPPFSDITIITNHDILKIPQIILITLLR